MGYLLKEALKTLCGVNQWSYAVFWKIGCQNPKLLIWEECYYESGSCSQGLGFSGNEIPVIYGNLQSGAQTGDKVHLLVNKMMMDNHVNIVGEGLVGRVAFTGNHQWVLSQNYYRDAHPPEVLKDLCQQFSAGMQTIAVIPVYPHGVVQFGSFLTIMENTGFVNDVTSLVLQLGCVPGVLLSENYAEKESFRGSSLESSMANPSCLFDSFNNQTSYPLARDFQASNSSPSHFRPQDYQQEAKLMNGVAKAEVIIPSNSEIWMSRGDIRCTDRKISSCTDNKGHFSAPNAPAGNLMSSSRTSSGLIYCSNGGSISEVKQNGGSISEVKQAASELKNVNLSNIEASKYDFVGHFTPNSSFSYDIPLSQHEHLNLAEVTPGFVEDDRKPMNNQPGDDLFDVLGADFKNKLFSDCWNSCLSNESAPNLHNWDKTNLPSKKSIASSEISDSGVFSLTGTDHLLDAVVSKVHPSSPSSKRTLDDNISCGTTLTNRSSSSAPNISTSISRFGISDQMKGELLGFPKYLAKAEAMSSCSLKTDTFKENSGTFSQSSSVYGSQISSWLEKGQKTKQKNSVSSDFSKKPDEMSKTNRKKLKPGENPRPRPKDRQMIQDRVKELREIVPNGAKCSIDALLERTIKHMLFLQSVTKHADKLKQTGESKIVSKDGGLLLKDNFEGGATWAYEVGSQSTVCPIIVEDLNQPRQMLVEMLCEERGLFLEIADIIRGLGLTILKGVMENRNDKIWARFAVEANRDVTRMEIFISLVRLLEQSAKSSAAQLNSISNENNTTIQQFHQVASPPVTGGSRSMQ
ncbi:hypothetical protein BUALT_Bualt02G0020200 [Buddleja alternifolia]|uniref:BHLH domain-containing protein n=1 Tax=Buddleja alternifolia TaxID=168488 RepID=A0AAV6XWK9_9LAMI|nr:hypothetical protein BUALT_Bualt02G0020200 [Buddleja alternifolia]